MAGRPPDPGREKGGKAKIEGRRRPEASGWGRALRALLHEWVVAGVFGLSKFLAGPSSATTVRGWNASPKIFAKFSKYLLQAGPDAIMLRPRFRRGARKGGGSREQGAGSGSQRSELRGQEQ